MDTAPEEVGALVERARTAFSGRGGRHAVVDLPSDLPAVLADGRRVVQVLDNAARHSQETSPIRVAAAHDGAHVAISVADEGEGVAPDALAHLPLTSSRLRIKSQSPGLAPFHAVELPHKGGAVGRGGGLIADL